MFGTNLTWKIMQIKTVMKTSFENVKADMNELKRSVTDWILYLDGNQRQLEIRVAELERELRKMKRNKQIIEVC
ncbi:hypothetical protein COV93_01565 [Candidatus Woesearchaeota archaeon CG11_big_fil_rev_8_21_14_0_20_43_8]|nr:MAG: hypothetical protein COV93_01565 [Candidatus Woesearchaeota archaeon CG11_big_fil_rev_8_21_14_0_20_43_8]PIO05465.1 MAG: hypothetical protein COT47_04725 [Candidatus Woesearchaeota archaeon CG08_land_8_20_14_0_20_43_7]